MSSIVTPHSPFSHFLLVGLSRILDGRVIQIQSARSPFSIARGVLEVATESGRRRMPTRLLRRQGAKKSGGSSCDGEKESKSLSLTAAEGVTNRLKRRQKSQLLNSAESCAVRRNAAASRRVRPKSLPPPSAAKCIWMDTEKEGRKADQRLK